MEPSRRLSDWPWVELRVDCTLCARRGRYRLARLAARYGSEMELDRMLNDLARDCPWRRSNPRKYEARCGIRLPDCDIALPRVERVAVVDRRSDPHDDAPRKKLEPNTAPLPTIGDSRRHGMTGFFVDCQRANCGSRRRFGFDELALPDDLVFVEIPRARRFRCARCGSRRVAVMADWPDPIRAQQRRMGVL